MAVVEPRRSRRDQVRLAFAMAATIAIGVIMAGVVGPIILAILVGEIWGHHA